MAAVIFPQEGAAEVLGREDGKSSVREGCKEGRESDLDTLPLKTDKDAYNLQLRML